MCLYTKMKEPGVAGYDITVYKVLEIHRNRLYAPVRAGYRYRLNELKKRDTSTKRSRAEKHT